MRNTIFVLLLSLTLLFTQGCVSAVTKDKVNNFTVQADSFVQRIEAEETTREEEQAFAYAVRVHAHILNWQLNNVDPPADVKLLLNIGD